MSPLTHEFRVAKIWSPVALLSALLLGFSLSIVELPPAFTDMALNWGPAFVILAAIAAGIVHYVPQNVVSNFVQAQQDQAVAMSSISESLKEISGHGGKIDDILSRLEEISLDQGVIVSRLKRIEEKMVYGEHGADS